MQTVCICVCACGWLCVCLRMCVCVCVDLHACVLSSVCKDVYRVRIKRFELGGGGGSKSITQ